MIVILQVLGLVELYRYYKTESSHLFRDLCKCLPPVRWYFIVYFGILPDLIFASCSFQFLLQCYIKPYWWNIYKVNLSMCLSKHHTMKTYWGSGGIAPHILDLGISWKWVVSFTPWPLLLPGKDPWYPLDRVKYIY